MGVRMSSSAPTSVIMKFLVLAASLSVCSAQGFFGLVGHPNGAVTPVDEPAVAAARAEHLATKFGAAPLVGPAAPLAVAGAPLGYAATPAMGYAGPLNLNTQLIGHPNGAVVPVDEPAVAAARADHINTQAAISAPQAPLVAPAISYAPSVAAVPAVAVARAEHLTTQGTVYAAQAPVVAAAPAVAYAATPAAVYAPAHYAGPLAGVPALVAHPNGAVVPADEPSVVAARADHLLSKGVYGGVYAGAAPVAAYGGL